MTRITLTMQHSLLLTGLFASQLAYSAPCCEQKEITDVGWSVELVSTSYDPTTDQTTFTYLLTASSWEKDLSHWTLALDEAPISTTNCSLEKFGLDPTTGVSGWKCDDGQNKGTTATYSLTFSGNRSEAPTDYSVKGGTYFGVGETFGPGENQVNQQTYTLSGVAFVDANNNGQLDNDEPRLGNVTVLLNNGQTTITDSLGQYQFSDLLVGQYDVVMPLTTPDFSDDSNEMVDGYFSATTTLTYSVSLTADATGFDFGFNVATSSVMTALGDGVLAGDGKTIGFWKHQVTSAKKGKTKGVQVSATQMNSYLFQDSISIQSLFLDVFADIPSDASGAYDYASAILSSTSSDATDLLKKQLMGTELNHLSGRGLTDKTLQGVLLAWAEYLVMHDANFTRSELLDAKDICDLINNTGE
jgi:hypothetical protein